MAEVEPAGTVTVPGTVAAPWLLVTPIETPPFGAGVLRVTVPVELDPPKTLVGLNVNEAIGGGFTVRVALNVADRRFALIVADVEVAT